MTTQPFSFSRVWDDAFAMLRANAGLLIAIAGVFLFLPAVLLARFVPPPESAATPAEMMEVTLAWWRGAAPWMLLGAVVNMVGLIAIYLLLLAAPRMTVGRAVAAALPILPFFFAVTFIINLAVGFGLVLLIVPGIYLLGRLTLTSPALVAETPRAPLTALQRSWELSGPFAWRIALLLIMVYVVAIIASFAAGAVLGSIIFLTLGTDGVGGLLVAILEALFSATTTLVATAVIAAIYRAVTAQHDVAARFT